MKIGHEHRDRVGERYVPSYVAPGAATIRNMDERFQVSGVRTET